MEANKFLNKVLMNKRGLRKNLRYLTIERTKFCEGFIEMFQIYLNDNEHLKRISLVLNI